MASSGIDEEELGQSKSRKDKSSRRGRSILQSVEKWFGLEEDDTSEQKWQARVQNVHHHSVTGTKPKGEERLRPDEDMVDAGSRRRSSHRRERYMVQSSGVAGAPVAMSGARGAYTEMKPMTAGGDTMRHAVPMRVARAGLIPPTKQIGLMDMALDGAKNMIWGDARSLRKPAVHSRSFAPADIGEYGGSASASLLEEDSSHVTRQTTVETCPGLWVHRCPLLRGTGICKLSGVKDQVKMKWIAGSGSRHSAKMQSVSRICCPSNHYFCNVWTSVLFSDWSMV